MLKKTLVTCSLFALRADTDTTKLGEVKIAVVGSWRGHSSGPFELTAEDLEQIKQNFDNSNIDVVADFEHASLWDIKAPATGWVKELELKGEELYAQVKWLDDAKELIKSEQYKYISPVFDKNTIDQVSGDDIGWSLHSLALTNRPFLEELGEVVANSNTPQKKEENEIAMTPEEKEEFEKLKETNKKLEAQLADFQKKRVEDEVDSAIAAKKVSPEQKDALLAFGKVDADGLTSLITAAKPMMQVPGDNLFPNSKDDGSKKEPYDVLALGGIK